jgi:hypothetical protein
MIFLPIEKITYKTILKEDEIINRLEDIIEPKKIFRGWLFCNNSTRPYEGEIKNNTFKLQRIIGYRNSFLPKIKGVIYNELGGTIIKVKMRLSVFVIVFICIWTIGMGLGCIAFMTQPLSFFTFIPFGLLLFMYALTMGGFKYESRKSKNDLKYLFETEIIDKK